MQLYYMWYKSPFLYHCNSCWLRHRCAPVIVTNITYVGNFTFTVATPAFNTMDPNHYTIAYRFIVFNFYILLWRRVIKYTMIINMNLSWLEWYTCVSYYSKKMTDYTRNDICSNRQVKRILKYICNLSYTVIWLICCDLSKCEIFGEFLSLYCLIVLMNDFISKLWNIFASLQACIIVTHFNSRELYQQNLLIKSSPIFFYKFKCSVKLFAKNHNSIQKRLLANWKLVQYTKQSTAY